MNHPRIMAAALSLAVSSAALSTAVASAAPALKLDKADHICLIGNSVADTMLHDGWLETDVVSRFPDDDLVFRDMGFYGDEVAFRDRSQDFGTPDQWLTKEKADVILAFFGNNEAWAGAKGLDKFKSDYDTFIKNSLKQQYNGKSAPKLVCFSPIAHEDIHSPNYPDGKENNKELKIYTDAMAEIAKANDVVFVDLYTPTLEAYSEAAKPLTYDGLHMTEEGDKVLGEIITKALFANAPAGKLNAAGLEKLRDGINDKNFYFFQHYDTLDGYNVYGGRSHERYPKQGGITNKEVMDREMEVIDVLTANRDKRVWALAQGKDIKVDDSNTPPFIDVKTNMPGPDADGSWPYPDPEEAIKHMKVAPGMKVELVASEKDDPDLINPVQMAFDTKGRLFVCTWPSYPHWKPKDPMDDKVVIVSDIGTNGKAGKFEVFADHLSSPTGLGFYNNGLLVAQAPYMKYFKDTTGGDKPNVVERVLGGIDSADSHHTENSFVLDPGGALYYQEGTFLHSQLESVWGPVERNQSGAVWRFEPRTGKIEPYMAYNFANPHGHVFDYWGTDVVFDGTGAVPFYGPTATGKTYFPRKHPKPPVIYKQRTRPCPGAEILSSPLFPEYNNNLMVLNVIGVQGIMNYKLAESGSGLEGTYVNDLVNVDPKDKIMTSFRPVDCKVGPDGAIYFLDWANVIIGHLQHHLRDPNRDHVHGRIYRIVPDNGKPLLTPAKIAGEPIDHLLDLLKDPTNRVRYRAKIELGGRDPKEVLPAVDKWIAALDPKDPAYQHNMMEGLWVYQYLNTVNEPLLKTMLRSPDYHARAAATRVLCYWRDRVKDPLALLKVQANDDSARVRLEAVRACSFFTTPDAQDVALESLNKPQDSWLKYSLDETIKTLENLGKPPKTRKK
ncbi:MAG TPA: HEAT repeat domain-containing protein [Tepidisphaeraceae bacterium]|nr:HEAT repeat domain-containing protein [Tepidisphaeraceae bacterium]